MRKRQEAVKLFVHAMRDATLRDRWVVDEDWVRHSRADSNDIGVHDMNMGLSNACNWHNDRFELEGYMLLHNV